MSKRIEIAHRVAEQLFSTEAAIDAALTQAAKLAGLMPSIREDARLSAIVGQDALERAIEVVSALGAARRQIVETHKQLSVTQREIGLGHVAFGGGTFKPNFAAGLKAVPTAEAA